MGKKTGQQTTAHYLFPATNSKSRASDQFNEKRRIAHKARIRKFPSKLGWLTFKEISELTGLKQAKFYSLLKTKTIDQILDEHHKI